MCCSALVCRWGAQTTRTGCDSASLLHSLSHPFTPDSSQGLPASRFRPGKAKTPQQATHQVSVSRSVVIMPSLSCKHSATLHCSNTNINTTPDETKWQYLAVAPGCSLHCSGRCMSTPPHRHHLTGAPTEADREIQRQHSKSEISIVSALDTHS